MPIRYIVIMIILFVLFVAYGLSNDFTPRPDKSMEQIEKMRERLKSQNSAVIKKRVELEKKTQQVQQNIEKHRPNIQRDIGAIKQNAMNRLGISERYVVAVYNNCRYANDMSHCMKYAIAVSVAESSWFTRCYLNNCYWIMQNGSVRRYDTIDENIADWVDRYNTWWWTNNTPQQWLSRSKYCTSGCEHRVKNVSFALDKLNK